MNCMTDQQINVKYATHNGLSILIILCDGVPILLEIDGQKI